MSVRDPFWLVLAGFGGGLVGSVAGLASLISYPALLAVGLPPVSANVSNTVASFNGAFGAGEWAISSVTLALTATSPNNAVFNYGSGSFAGRETRATGLPAKYPGWPFFWFVWRSSPRMPSPASNNGAHLNWHCTAQPMEIRSSM